MNFEELGLSAPLVRAVVEQGYKHPSPIQRQAIPLILQGRDVMAAAQTGTGKTAGFTLPLLDRLAKGSRPKANQARALILTPTRELAAQVAESVSTYGRYVNLCSDVVFGGVKINPQMKRLRGGCDILVATPGRLIDLYQQNAVKFRSLEILVLDEADRMLDMGFIHAIKRVMTFLPRQRQTLMFSATFSGEIRSLAKGLMHQPVEVSASTANSTATTIKQWVHTVDKKSKPALLTELIRKQGWDQALVFTKTKRGANKLSKHLEDEGITSGAIHGNKSQSARTNTLAKFKAGEIRILVATDIAARGLDIDQLPQVVNFDLPYVAEDYVHRIGRTGRAGALGKAISLVSADEVTQLTQIERLIKQRLTREVVEGFEPLHEVPDPKRSAYLGSGAHGPSRNHRAKAKRSSPSKTHRGNGARGKATGLDSTPKGSRSMSKPSRATLDGSGSKSKDASATSNGERTYRGGSANTSNTRTRPAKSGKSSGRSVGSSSAVGSRRPSSRKPRRANGNNGGCTR